MNNYNKITLLDRPDQFTNNGYIELSKVFKNYKERQLFEGTQKMLLST